jgi:selenocysteine lyase/cysteine desulfurase
MEEDAIDALIGNAGEFPILDHWDFYNHAGVSPLPRRAAMAMVKYAGEAAERSYVDTHWYRRVEEVRLAAARFIGADKDEMAFVKNTSEGLGMVAGGLAWNQGDRIVTTAVEYPANAYPWLDLQQRRGVEVARVEEVVDGSGVRRVPLESILKEIARPRTRLVTLSMVEFGTGQRHDLATISKACRDVGALLCVDAIQALGAVPLDVRALGIDFLSADSHKWLLGPEGAGIFYCRRNLIEKLHPVVVGWLSVKRPHEFERIVYDLKNDASRFECGTHNVAGILGMGAALDLLSQVGLAQIWRRLSQLTDRLVEGVEALGFTVASPRAAGEASGIVSFGKEGLDVVRTARELRENHIELAVRFGRLRCSPHFYNTEAQVNRLLAELAKRA